MAGRAPKLLDFDALMEYAGRALGSRAQYSSELRTRLKRRAARQEDVEQVIARMKDLGYLNDRRFADSFANWRRENQGVGKGKVIRDLMARRVAPAVARQAAETAYKESDEVALIEQFLERKYRGKDLGALLQEEKHLASAYRKLVAAGFGSGNSIRVLKRYAAEADRLEEMPLEEPE
jgi:regulatory protein